MTEKYSVTIELPMNATAQDCIDAITAAMASYTVAGDTWRPHVLSGLLAAIRLPEVKCWAPGDLTFRPAAPDAAQPPPDPRTCRTFKV